jgi:hypothetical protein
MSLNRATQTWPNDVTHEFMTDDEELASLDRDCAEEEYIVAACLVADAIKQLVEERMRLWEEGRL